MWETARLGDDDPDSYPWPVDPEAPATTFHQPVVLLNKDWRSEV